MNYGLLISIYEVQILPNIYNYLIAVAFNGTIIASNNMVIIYSYIFLVFI